MARAEAAVADLPLDPVGMLVGMVSIPSVSGGEGPLAQALVAAMSALGFDAHVDAAGNAVGTRCGAGTGSAGIAGVGSGNIAGVGTGGVGTCSEPAASGRAPRELVLLGHLDTVPGHIPVRLADGRLHGRGSVDAKGPLAAFVQAVARARPAPGVRLTVVGAVEEEVASSAGARAFARQAAPEACLIGEPSGWDALTLGYKGCTGLRYRKSQEVGHGAGRIAPVAEQAVAFWNAITRWADDFNRERGRVVDQLTPSLRGMSSRGDGLTETAELQLGFRLPEGLDVEALFAHARAVADGAELDFQIADPAWSTPRTSGLVGAFGRALVRQGGKLRYKHKTGTSDMNVLGPVWRCPIVAYGPGDSALDHTPHEQVEIAEYLRAIDVLAAVLEEDGWALPAAGRRAGLAAEAVGG